MNNPQHSPPTGPAHLDTLFKDKEVIYLQEIERLRLQVGQMQVEASRKEK